MDEILRRAKELGEAIAAHERCQALKQANEALQGDEEATRLQKEYSEAAHALREKEFAGQPLEPEEKRAEAELRQKVAAHPVIREFLKAQVDFAELMQQANATLEGAIGLE